MAEERRLTFGEHLEELRHSVLLGVISLGSSVLICMIFYNPLLSFLLYPIRGLAREKHFQIGFLNPTDPFMVTMKVSCIAGLVLASPFIIYFLWNFVSEGLYPREKKYIQRYVPITAGLFIAGFLFFYFVMLPPGLRFLIDFIDIPEVRPNIALDEYVSFFLLFSLAMGLVFEVPIVLIALQGVGLVTPKTLARYRKHAFLGCVIVAAIVTPTGDPLSLTLCTVPMILLFEVGLWVGRIMERKKLERNGTPTPSS